MAERSGDAGEAVELPLQSGWSAAVSGLEEVQSLRHDGEAFVEPTHKERTKRIPSISTHAFTSAFGARRCSVA